MFEPPEVDKSSALCHAGFMEATSDKRYDPHLPAQVLLEIAREQSLQPILDKIVTHGSEKSEYVIAQVWLVDKGDLCKTCKHRAVCTDHSRCLHLAAAKGTSILTNLTSPSDFDDLNARLPLNANPVGEAVAGGRRGLVTHSQATPMTLPGFDWLHNEGVCGYGVCPILYKGEALGALVGFTRDSKPHPNRPWADIFADHLGAAIANARSFAEIERLRAQLELHNVHLQEEVVEARAFGDLIGQSCALRQIVGQVDLVAPTDASVLIQGETGTGKELVAREIHRRSARKDKPLVRVNCASIPKELFESEFFGHARGSFTGAIKDRAGRFETAEGGTLFLDEIGEVPLDMQGKLLRVLQEKRYERVGEDRTRTANVRIVAATNRELKKEVAAGRFREDLYYRLNVFPIQVAPLRERKDDIPLLAKHFVELSVKELRCAKPRLTRAGVVKLQNYDWPGNVRELRNVIERAVILARGGTLEFDLPIQTAASPPPRSMPHPELPTAGPDEPELLTEAELQLLERNNLLSVLTKANWKIKGPDGAAELLGVKPTTLLSRMEKWGLRKPGR